MIGFLGPVASFTHAAAQRLFQSEPELVSLPSITEVFNALREGRISKGVVPIENSTHGVVRESIDQLLLGSPTTNPETLDEACSSVLIERELALPIHHHLLASKLVMNSGLPERIVSHVQALAQCKKFLDEQYPMVPRLAVGSTALAASQAAQDPKTWAIGSELAASEYSLIQVDSDINDCAQNTTRFIVIGSELSPPSTSDRTTFVFTTPHKKGALLSILQILFDSEINLTRIESRPLIDYEWEYCFVVEVEGHETKEPLRAVLKELLKRKSLVRTLGSYPFSSQQ